MMAMRVINGTQFSTFNPQATFMWRVAMQPRFQCPLHSKKIVGCRPASRSTEIVRVHPMFSRVRRVTRTKPGALVPVGGIDRAMAGASILFGSTLAGCSNYLSDMPIVGKLMMAGFVVATIAVGVVSIQNHLRIKRVFQALGGNMAVFGIKEAIGAGITPKDILKTDFVLLRHVIEAVLEIMVEKETGQLTRGDRRERRAFAIRNVEAIIEDRPHVLRDKFPPGLISNLEAQAKAYLRTMAFNNASSPTTSSANSGDS